MAHRGRLNVLANIVGKPLAQIFSEFEGDVDPQNVQGSGDVKYHLGATGVHDSDTARRWPLTLAPNPSHLESGRSGRRGHGAREAGRASATSERARVLPDPAPRRRRVRRPGHRRGDAEPRAARRLPHRRHHPRRHQQPDRLHDLPDDARSSTYSHRRRQDGAGADLPRQRRRPGGGRPRRRARVRVPPAVPAGRRHRHDRATAAGATTKATSRATRSRSCTPRSRTTPSVAHALRRAAWCATDADDRARSSTRVWADKKRRRCSARATAARSAPARTKRRRRRRPRSTLAAMRTDELRSRRCTTSAPCPRVSRSTPSCMPLLEKRRGARCEAGDVDWAHRRGAGLRHAGAGRHPGAPERAGLRPRHLQPAPCRASTTSEHRHASTCRSALSRRQAALRGATTACSPKRRAGLRVRLRGRRSTDALVMWEAQFGDFVNGAQVIIDQFLAASRRRSGASRTASSCCCRTATKARGRSTRARASSAS